MRIISLLYYALNRKRDWSAQLAAHSYIYSERISDIEAKVRHNRKLSILYLYSKLPRVERDGMSNLIYCGSIPVARADCRHVAGIYIEVLGHYLLFAAIGVTS